MKTPTRQQLLEIAYQHYARGVFYDDPGYMETPEYLRLTAAWDQALAHTETWDRFNDALLERFGDSVRLSHVTMPWHGGGFRLAVDLDWPLRRGKFVERATIDVLVACVSVIAPLYLIHGVQVDVVMNRRLPDPRPLYHDLTPEMRTHLPALAEDVERVFGYAPVSMEDALAVVPDISIYPHGFGQMRLIHALFASYPENVF